MLKTTIFNIRNVSSVGLEHYFDRVGVTGSSPVQSTRKITIMPLSTVNCKKNYKIGGKNGEKGRNIFLNPLLYTTYANVYVT